jgi:acyl-CoA synthetase (AMP-forming)/AMP-acid ligase II
MFKVKGASVYPSEVEAALVAIPEVERAYVVAVGDGTAPEVGAVVVAAAGVDCTVEQLTAATRARLSAFKVPTRWSVIPADEVPTTATGKVDQSAVKRLLAAPVEERA